MGDRGVGTAAEDTRGVGIPIISVDIDCYRGSLQKTDYLTVRETPKVVGALSEFQVKRGVGAKGC